VEPAAFGENQAPKVERLNPLEASPEMVQRGEALFNAMNCSGCHGPGGIGFLGPSLVDGRWRYGGEDGDLYLSIVSGRPRGMPAYDDILSAPTVWQLVTYIRSLPVPLVVPTVAWMPREP